MSTAVQSSQHTNPTTHVEPGFLVFDTESVPDGRLIAAVKYAGESISPEDAVDRFQRELREKSFANSDFVPVMYQFPVALCIVRVGTDYSLQKITRLGEPSFEPRKIVEQFWLGYSQTRERLKDKIKLVTFNGRGFDLPLLETAAFRYGLSARDYFQSRNSYSNRYSGGHIDVLEFLANFGAVRGSHCQDALAKLLGLPGKMGVAGHQVYGLHRDGKTSDIADYCLCDTLDLYFIFLRTRVMTGELTLEQEDRLNRAAREYLASKTMELPVLKQYLDLWVGWNPRP